MECLDRLSDNAVFTFFNFSKTLSGFSAESLRPSAGPFRGEVPQGEWQKTADEADRQGTRFLNGARIRFSFLLFPPKLPKTTGPDSDY